MATQPTNLPVPSESYRDLKYNAGKIDEFVTSLTLQYIDRFGNAHYTIEGLRWLAQQAIAQYGWIPVGTFQDGATLTLPNQILKDTTDGSYYRWDGDLPKTVPSGSTPSTSGGTGVGAWLSVGDSTLRSMLAAPGGDKLIGSSWGGASVWEDYPYKGSVKPSKVIYPTMTNSAIQTILSGGGEIYVSDGTYEITSTSETWKLSQNTRVTFSSGALLKPTVDGVTVLRMSSLDVSSQFIRNAKCFGPRIDMTGRSGCIGIHFYNARNNSGIYYPWVDMGIGTNNTGIKVEFMSYGLTIRDPEVLNGGVGGRRIFILNGPNAINIENHRGYSSDPANKCDYGIVIFNSTDGSTNVDFVNTFTTAAVCITGGFSQNTSLYGINDSADGTNVYGMYFERNDVADISLSSGSRDFYCVGIQHSHSVGDCMYRGRGCVGAVIQSPSNGLRTRWFDFSGASQCYAYIPRARAFPAGTLVPIGNTDGLAVDRGAQSFSQYTSTSLPIDVRQGYALYYLNVTSGMNITVSGTPYNGQKINMLVRGSEISSLSFSGVPVDVTGANTTQTKTASFTATYWTVLGKWTLTMPQWTASS
ncbi:hypothetical protein ACUQZ3_004041 [Enterobacter hormaechei]|uniref:tail fiber/spike domain-containing protein n=3 Tax=Enterobacter hormaechei TaxID=158836 RepID=UPI000BD66D91|nr:hypothetical protein [Enterobacter hormaechei]EKS6306094.1 hypothetical protein [Enterobacter hormaechei]EKX4902017.1 hypothetical protein [Enterobacter hormaechei]ELD2093096.1 hypothetical protein [Enterobacter hormaechei]MCO0818940.1 hypothetical protein [Enterobacter hormaechei]MDT8099173.1 hypothetical protein [Enterobacter hormaechei]